MLAGRPCSAVPDAARCGDLAEQGRQAIQRLVCAVQQQPAELYGEYTTIEYQAPANNVLPPAYVFIIDTSVAEDELRACVASLSQAITTLPEYTQVCSPACSSPWQEICSLACSYKQGTEAFSFRTCRYHLRSMLSEQHTRRRA